MPQPIIHISSLSHAYAHRRALDNLSLDILPNEIFGFLGPNGSGKTTLFRILSTLIPPQSGTVTITLHAGAERSAAPAPPCDLRTHRDALRRHLAVVFQSPSLDQQLTAEENLRHHGHLYGLHGQNLTDRIHHILARFDLLDRRHEYVRSLSGGLRRRVELAKGLLTRPQILLMDEPSTGLDPAARLDLWRLLHDLRRQDDLTILLTTHLMDEADRCDRLAILDHGRLAACDTPTHLKNQIGGDVITLTSRHPITLQEMIQQKLGYTPELLDGALRLEIPNAHQVVPQLVQAAPGLIESLSIAKPTLQDVFIHATGRHFDQP